MAYSLPSRLIDIADVGARDQHVHRHAGAGIHDSAELPSAEQQIPVGRACWPNFCPFRRADHTACQIEALPDIEVIVSAIRSEVVGIAGCIRFVGPAVLPMPWPQVYCAAERQAAVEAPVQSHLQGVVVIGSAAGLVIDFCKAIPELAGRR